MSTRSLGTRLPVPLGDILLFAGTVTALLLLWRLSGNALDCNALAAAVGSAVALGWWDTYRRERRRTDADRTMRSSSA